MKTTLLLLLSWLAFAQTPAFDVADVHPSKSGSFPSGGFMPGGRLELQNFSIFNLITYAYGVDGDMVVGGPPWLNTDRFDVRARSPRGTTEDSAKLMLRTVLADRFKLTTRTEDRLQPAFVLTVGKRSLLKEAAGTEEADCQPQMENPPSPWIRIDCKNLTMPSFAQRVHQWAGAYLDHPVVDQTGLKGGYDFSVRWVGRGMLSTVPDGLSIFDAVEKQLGLKLEAKKQSLPAIVIESVERAPTPNPPDVTERLPAAATEFEVADIKPSKDGTPTMLRMQPNGRLDAEGVPLRLLIQFAYNNMDNNSIIGPKWLESERFSIVAKASGAVPIETLRAMLKALVVDRFKLVVHNEEQVIPAYVLSAGKRPKIETSAGTERAGCKTSMANGLIVYDCKSTTMAQFAEQIHLIAGGYLDHPVVDGTDLAGAYNFTLSWTPRQNLPGGAGRGGDAAPPAPGAPATAPGPAEPAGLTLFEAVDRQMGLKLDLQKRSLPVIVIDHVNQAPTEN